MFIEIGALMGFLLEVVRQDMVVLSNFKQKDGLSGWKDGKGLKVGKKKRTQAASPKNLVMKLLRPVQNRLLLYYSCKDREKAVLCRLYHRF